MQHARGFIVGCANRVTLISWEAEHTEQQIGQAFYRQKTILSAYYIRVTKWLVTCLQSNPIGTNFAGFCSNLEQFYWYKGHGLLFKLRRPWAFQLSRGLLLGAYWLAGSRSPNGGGESHHFTETETQVPAACQPQPRQPHIIKLISQLQKPTRRTTDTWIIDTGKRETRYQLVKVHQTIRQPHKKTTVKPEVVRYPWNPESAAQLWRKAILSPFSFSRSDNSKQSLNSELAVPIHFKELGICYGWHIIFNKSNYLSINC